MEMGEHPAGDSLGARFYLRTAWFQVFLEQKHLRHRDFARRLGLSRAYWSMLFHRHRHVTPAMRRRLLRMPLLKGVPEYALWERAL
jgi:hypothetical protein